MISFETHDNYNEKLKYFSRICKNIYHIFFISFIILRNIILMDDNEKER